MTTGSTASLTLLLKKSEVVVVGVSRNFVFILHAIQKFLALLNQLLEPVRQNEVDIVGFAKGCVLLTGLVPGVFIHLEQLPHVFDFSFSRLTRLPPA